MPFLIFDKNLQKIFRNKKFLEYIEFSNTLEIIVVITYYVFNNK